MNKELLQEINDLEQTIEQMTEFLKITTKDLMDDIRFGSEYNSPFKGMCINNDAFREDIVNTLKNIFKEKLPRLQKRYDSIKINE